MFLELYALNLFISLKKSDEKLSISLCKYIIYMKRGCFQRKRQTCFDDLGQKGCSDSKGKGKGLVLV